MHLPQDVLPQSEPEVGIDIPRTLSDQESSIGQAIDGSAIPSVVAFEDEVLDDVVAVALQDSIRWQIVGLQDMILIDANVFGFVPLAGAGAFARWFCGRRLGRLDEHTGFDHGACGGAFIAANSSQHVWIIGWSK